MNTGKNHSISVLHLQIEDVPWRRLTTCYGRGTNLPQIEWSWHTLWILLPY